MVKRKRVWVYSPPKAPKPKVPEGIKAELTQKAQPIVETKFKPYRFKLDEGNEEKRFNHVIDIYTKWWRNYFYFCLKFHCPGPNAISEYFDDQFTRMEYMGDGKFNLSYKRHTGQWWQVYENLGLNEALKTIEEEITFWP